MWCKKPSLPAPADSWVARHDIPSDFAGHYDPSFSLALCCKDLGLVNQIAQSQGYSLTMGAHAQALVRRGKGSLWGRRAAELHVVKLLEDRVGPAAATLARRRRPETTESTVCN
jgi:3-hydroxyisobutyrate dehydrogenase-like beta-hydroxyacid dehydrogenase